MPDEQVHFRVRDPERIARWKKLADQSHMSLSDWIRHTLDNGRVIKPAAK
jgi:hypothetical protein